MIWENLWTVVWSIVWYFILTLLLPSICLKKYVKEKELTFRFFFYQCAGNLYQNFVVLALGFVGILNRYTLFLMLILLPLGACGWRDRACIKAKVLHAKKLLNELLNGTYGSRLLGRKAEKKFRNRCMKLYRRYIQKNLPEVLLFLGIMAWVFWFYGEYKFQNLGYAHTDEETHLYWIGELIHGNLFPAGMYPHGMHTLVAAIAVLSGMTLPRVYLMFAVLSTALVFGTAYLLFRRIIENKYVAMAGWGMFVITDIFRSITYIRFQISFPMEFGLIAAFSMIYFMLRYVKQKEKSALLAFALSIAWTLSVHFYITLLCGAICVAFAFVYFIVLVRRKMLLSFLAAGIAGILISCVPYVAGAAAGFSFERSIAWALGIAQTGVLDDTETNGESAELTMLLEKENPWGKQELCLEQNFVKNRKIAGYLMYLDAFLILYGLLGLIFSKRKEKYQRYLFWGVFWEVGAFLACTYYLNFPAVIEVKRMASFLAILTVPLFGLPFELVAQLCSLLHIRPKFANALLGLLTIALFGGCFYRGRIKDDRYYCITISEGDARVCFDLLENEEKHTWTVLSPVNDLSIIRYDGFHYEITDLIKNLDEGKDVYIPTPDIYVVTEKKAISFATEERAIDHSDMLSPGNVKELSPELALTDIEWERGVDSIHQADAPYYFSRDVLMSKLYYWMKGIQEVFPNHISCFYEDALVCVYHIKQDPYFLLNLSVDYRMYAEQEKETE